MDFDLPLAILSAESNKMFPVTVPLTLQSEPPSGASYCSIQRRMLLYEIEDETVRPRRAWHSTFDFCNDGNSFISDCTSLSRSYQTSVS